MSKVRFAVLSGLSALLARFDVKTEEVLAKANLAPNFFDIHSEDDLLDYQVFESILSSSAGLTQQPHFAAKLGCQQDMRFLGLVGYLMRQATTVAEALEELKEHFSLLVTQAAQLSIRVDGSQASLQYSTIGEIRAYQHCNELAVAQGVMMLRALCGARWNPSCLHFTHICPGEKQDYSELFKVSVLFEESQNQILFDSGDLDKPIIGADPVLKRILEQQVLLASTPNEDDICDQVENFIHQTLPTGKCSVETISELMCVHRRTLHRTLKAKNSSFTKLLENVRQRIALERLENSIMPIAQLADYLGYTDSSAFNRAFKRWTNSTPRRWRQNCN